MNRKLTFRFYSEYDIKGIVNFLDKIAASGWLLEKKSGVFYSFVKTDKPFVKYDITYFTDAEKVNGYRPYDADRYFEMAQAAGWQFLTNDHKMQIFISEKPDATPLETEPMIKVDVIHKSFLSQWWAIYAVLIFNGVIRFLDKDLQFMDIMIMLAGLAMAWDLCCYFVWYFKAKKAAADGWYYETRTPFVRMYLDPIILLLMIAGLWNALDIKAFVFLVIIGYAFIRRVDIFDAFLAGATAGLKSLFGILPALVGLVVAITVFRSSGALNFLTGLLAPLTDFLHIPNELMPLAILRPISGSGSLALVNDLLQSAGPDSMVGRIASVVMGSTETTFYTLAVYYGSVHIRDTRYTVPAALTADLVGFLAGVYVCLLLY